MYACPSHIQSADLVQPHNVYLNQELITDNNIYWHFLF